MKIRRGITWCEPILRFSRNVRNEGFGYIEIYDLELIIWHFNNIARFHVSVVDATPLELSESMCDFIGEFQQLGLCEGCLALL